MTIPRVGPDDLTHRLLPTSLQVVGVRHANSDKSNRRFLIRLCIPGEPVELRPEPENEFDEHAIAVFSNRGKQLGYLTAERAPRIGRLIREGRELQAVFQAEAQFGAWIRVAFDGEVPAVSADAAPLAPARTVAAIGGEDELGRQPEPEWYPDVVWPDE